MQFVNVYSELITFIPFALKLKYLSITRLMNKVQKVTEDENSYMTPNRIPEVIDPYSIVNGV